MSNQVFPQLPGLRWNQTKTPIFSTLIQKAVSGRETRTQFYIYPLWHYGLSFELLRDNNAANELKQIMGLYLQHWGGFDSFLYLDQSDYRISNQFIGYGNANGTAFQMARTYGGFTEPIFQIVTPSGNNNANNAINIYLNGNLQSANNYILSYNTGVLAFLSAPPSGANITVDVSYYWRVRFFEYSEDSDEAFSQFMQNLWELRQLDLITVRGGGNMIPLVAEYLGMMASDPNTTGWNSAQEGFAWYNTTDHYYKYWNGNAVAIY
jgi:uncharacterized protein (TIGR02217 family)